MGRRKKRRFVQGLPDAVFFKPQGVPLRQLKRRRIAVEGFEALRLVDGQGHSQQEAAEMMGVSRPTLGRILNEARERVATALTRGWAIEIEGGAYHLAEDAACAQPKDNMEEATMRQRNGQGRNMGQGGRGQGMGQGMGQGTGQGRGMGPCGGGLGRGGGQARGGAAQAAPASAKTIRKIAVSSEGTTLDDAVDPRFGRAGGFVLVDLESMETEYIDNGASQMRSQGAGIQAAETVARSGADAVLTGYVGPKAFTALSAAGILVGQDVEDMTVRQAVERYNAGQVDMAGSPNAPQGANK